MGVHVIKVPDVGEGIAEVELVSWAVAIGDPVSRNQILAEVMTDKANVEIPAPVDGVIASLSGDIGGILAVGSPLIELTVAGDGTPPADATGASVASPPAQTAAPAADPVAQAPPAPPSGPVVPARPAAARVSGPPRAEGERPLASPAVRAKARSGGVDLRYVPGTGPAGRVTHEDLDAYWRANGSPGRGGQAGPHGSAMAGGGQGGRLPDETVTAEPIIGIRRQIARRMVASTQSIPHITYVEEIDVTALETLRAALNGQAAEAGAPRLTVLPFLALAIVDAVGQFPHLNAHVDDETETLTTFGGVHIGIATQTPNGLVVPVVRHAEAASIWDLAGRIADVTERARIGKAAPAEFSGSTITITSLGSLGGIATTPVINKPEVSIVGVNKIVTRPVFADETGVAPGSIVARKLMNLSSSFDHRIVDGWDAASFIQRIRSRLEEPATLFVPQPPSVAG